MAVFDSPGKGRKQCPSCNKYVGVKSRQCDNCNHSFYESGASPTPATTKSMESKAPPYVKSEKAQLSTKVVQQYDEPGKLRKQCPECLKYVHCAVGICPCGHNLKESTPKPQPQPQSQPQVVPQKVTPEVKEVRQYRDPSIQRVWIPSGACPVKLKGLEPEQIHQWAEDVRAVYHSRREFLSLDGLIYFGKWIYPFYTEEFRIIKETLQALYGHEN